MLFSLLCLMSVFQQHHPDHSCGLPCGLQEMAELKRQLAEDPECTFKPALHSTIGALAASHRALWPDETQEEFVERLASEGVRRQAVLQAIDNIYQKQHTFQPTINQRSRTVRTNVMCHARHACAIVLPYERDTLQHSDTPQAMHVQTLACLVAAA